MDNIYKPAIYDYIQINPSQGLITIQEVNMREKVEKAIEKIRPFLQRDGGDIELIDVADGIVKVKLQGACGSCPMSAMTLKMGVEKQLKDEIPEVKEVISI